MRRIVRDEGVAGSNPATPTIFPRVVTVMGNDMGTEPPGVARAVECLVIKHSVK
jgi:hypothetical protein